MRYRVWHIPNVPGNAFHQEVKSIDEAKLILMTLARYDLYLGDNVISNNAQGLEVLFELGDSLDYPELSHEWEEWTDPDDEARYISDMTRSDPMESVDVRRWR